MKSLINKKNNSTILATIVVIAIIITFYYYSQTYSEGFGDELNMKRPFLHIYTDEGKKTNVVFITHPFSRKGLYEEYENAKNKGYYFIGMSSYIDFPGLLGEKPKIANPHDAMHDENHMAWNYNYFDLVEGWCHCFRHPEKYIPHNIPKALISESEFVSNSNIDPPEDNSKDYDFIYICLKDNDKCEDGWQSHNRNWDLAQKCLDIMCNKYHLRGLLIGRVNCKLPSGCHNLMKTTDFMDYSEFIIQYHKARFIFIPNQDDASPRVLAEGLLRNLPALVNYNILGGWKYINEQTGELFNGMEDFEIKLQKLLNNYSTYKPKEHFLSNYGKEYQGKDLFEFIKSIIPNDKLNFDIDKTKYLYPGV